MARYRRAAGVALTVLASIAWGSSTGFAQLDPLLFIKRVPPTIILVVDTSMRMLEDGQGYFYDPHTYRVADDIAVADALGVDTGAVTTYRRVYRDLRFENVIDANSKYEATTVTAVPDTAPDFAAFWDPTRLEIAKQGIAQAVGENSSPTYRWGLVKLRQSNPTWRIDSNCDRPVRITGSAALAAVTDSNPCAVGVNGRFGIYAPEVSAANFSVGTSGGGAVVVPAGADTANAIVTTVTTPMLDPQGLIPAGRGARSYADRPLTHALDDAKAEAIAAMSALAPATQNCCNTIVVLVTGGKDDGDSGYTQSHDPTGTATGFLSVSAGAVTKRVPIYVAAISPDPGDEAQLQAIATNSSGRYFNVSDATDVARVINLAVQSGFALATDFDSGKPSEFHPVSPIVGTVNLENALDAGGNALPNTDIQEAGGVQIPQRSNLLLSAGFKVNGSSPYGFEGTLRAFRVYKPEPDATRPSGYTFVADGTRLWPSLDGRPETAGAARLPADPNDRNIFTYVPGAGIVELTVANGSTIGPHLGGADPDTLIPVIRSLPLGAVINSTPAIMDPPSLDPPPDQDYGRPEAPGTYAGDHSTRRSIIWVGANDGMLHGIDARTGFEVWAFVPYNLLPKLRTLMDGQPVDQFDYFVDSSPKVAEVKVNGAWRTILVIGQGAGGTFYQAFDVTEAGMGGPPPDSNAYNGVLASFSNPSRVTFMWSFPRYSEFDTNVFASLPVSDGTAGGRVRFYGDLKTSASFAEKSVGFTWSDPAVGPLNPDRTVNAVITGSGYFPGVESQLPGRGAGAPAAGRYLYLISVEDGRLVGNPGGGACGGTGCIDVGVIPNNIKNAIQADVAAAGASAVTKAYVGDLDGRYWRFDFNEAGSMSSTLMTATNQPIYNSSALLSVGSSDQHMFFSTGSDLLPTTAGGGTGTFKLFGLKDDFPGAGATVNFSHPLTVVTNSGGLATGERPSSSPSVAGDIVFYTTTTEDASQPCADFSSNLYAFTFLGGAAYDTDNSGSVTGGENPKVKTVGGRATALFIVDQHAFFGTSGQSGAKVEIFGDPEDFNNGVGQVGVRLLSWRELR